MTIKNISFQKSLSCFHLDKISCHHKKSFKFLFDLYRVIISSNNIKIMTIFCKWRIFVLCCTCTYFTSAHVHVRLGKLPELCSPQVTFLSYIKLWFGKGLSKIKKKIYNWRFFKKYKTNNGILGIKTQNTCTSFYC